MRSDPDCIFCKIVSGAIPCFKIFENDDTLAFMDINPANDGHVLVIPKEHFPDVYSIPDGTLAAVAITARRVARAAGEALPMDGLNLVQCNGKGASQSVMHLHVHVLPRRLGDELKLNWGLRPGDMSRIEELAGRIRASL